MSEEQIFFWNILKQTILQPVFGDQFMEEKIPFNTSFIIFIFIFIIVVHVILGGSL